MGTRIPHTKQEAFAQLDELLSEKDKNELVIGDAIEFHFSLGMWIRNRYLYKRKRRHPARQHAEGDGENLADRKRSRRVCQALRGRHACLPGASPPEGNLAGQLYQNAVRG